MRLSDRTANVLLLLISLSVCALLLILATRWLRSGFDAALNDYGALISFDPTRTGGHLLPNVQQAVQGASTGQAVNWRTDAHGFRIDGELSLLPAVGVRRIFLLGDSFVDGMRTDQRLTIGALLEDALRARGEAVEVVISGHNNPANAWYWLQTHSPQFKPTEVILGLTLGNDLFAQNLHAGMQPDARAGRVRLVDAGMLDGDLRRMPAYLPASAYRAPSWWRDQWYAQTFALRGALAEQLGWFADSIPPFAGASKPRRVWDRDIYASLGLFHVPINGFAEFSYASNRETLNGIATLLRERGIAFSVVIFPVRHQVSPLDWQRLVDVLALNPTRFDLDAPNRRLLADCASLKISCLDPTVAMRAHMRAGLEPLYRPRGDMHFNEAGNRFIARMLVARRPAPIDASAK